MMIFKSDANETSHNAQSGFSILSDTPHPWAIRGS